MRLRKDSGNRIVMFVVGLAACCALVLTGCSASSDSGAVGDAAAPVVVLLPDGWEPPAQTEADILADRILRRKDDSLILDMTERTRLAGEIVPVLSSIRDACPVLEDEDVTVRMPYAFGKLLLGLEPQLYDTVASLLHAEAGPVTLETGYADFDSLNESLGLSFVDLFSFSQTATFYFSEYLNIPVAADAYELVEGIQFAESDSYFGDGSDIDAVKSEGSWYVVARRAWGDCPSGCINQELFFFIVDDATAKRVDHEEALDRAEFSGLVMNRGWQMRSFEGC